MNVLIRVLLTCCLLALGLATATSAWAVDAVDDSYTLNPADVLFDGQEDYFLLSPSPLFNNDLDFNSGNVDQVALDASITVISGAGDIRVIPGSTPEFRYYPGTAPGFGTAVFSYTLTDPQPPQGPTSDTATITISFTGADDPCLNADSEFCSESLTDSERSQHLSTVAAQTEAMIGMQQRMADQLRSRFSELRNGTNRLSLNHFNARIYGESLALGQWSQEGLNEITGGGASDSIGDMEPWGVFVNGSVAVGERDSDDATIGYDADGYNVSLGLDYRFSEALVWGGALGLGNDELEFGRNLGKQESDLTSLATFINFYPGDTTYVDALLIYGLADIDTRRNILDETAQGSTEGDVWSAALSAGYEMVSDAWQYGAFTRLEYVKASVDGYSEQGSSNDFSVAGHDKTSTELAVGGRIGRAFSLESCVMVPALDLEWVHQFESDARLLGVSLEGVEPVFGAYDEGFDQGHANVGLSLSAVYEAGVSSFVRAETTVADDIMTLQTYSAGMRWEF